MISGRVLRPGGHPLAGAMVRLTPTAATMAPPKLAITDIEGAYRFVLPKEAAGTYRVTAVGGAGHGYLETAYGQPRASDPGEEITVASGETRDRLVITMMEPGAIAGRLFDENGDPVEGVVPRASQIRYIDGRRRLVDMARFAQPTDDLGRFRLFGLEPGEYLVSAAVGQIDMQAPLVDLPGYGTTYFPRDAESGRGSARRRRPFAGRVGHRLSDRAHQDRASVRTRCRLERRADYRRYRPDAESALRRGGDRTDGRPDRARTAGSNSPTCRPASYVLQASRHRSAAWNEGESSTQFVTVNGVDVADLVVRTATGSTVDGRIVIDD